MCIPKPRHAYYSTYCNHTVYIVTQLLKTPCLGIDQEIDQSVCVAGLGFNLRSWIFHIHIMNIIYIVSEFKVRVLQFWPCLYSVQTILSLPIVLHTIK